MKTLHLLSLGLLIPLAGCQYDNYHYETPDDEPWRSPEKGTVVELKQSLTFVPGSSRTYIQDGVASNNYRGINHYRPWCQFYLYESKDEMKHTRTIEPDKFTVVKASQGIKYVQTAPITVAAIGVGFGFGASNLYAVDDIGAQTLATTMILTSETQPQVRELVCSTTDDARRDNFVSINKIKATLGDIATLHPPTVQ